MINSEPEAINRSPQVEILSAQEAQRIEGLCKEAESYWTAFLVESKLWDEKPEIIDLVTPEGVFLGKAIRKDSTKIDKKLEENGHPIHFGKKSYLMITPDSNFPDLENTLLVQIQGKIIARKFGETWEQNENIFRDKAELASQLSGDERMEEVQLLIDLMKEDIAKDSEADAQALPEETQPSLDETQPSLEEVFNSHLSWVKENPEENQ